MGRIARVPSTEDAFNPWCDWCDYENSRSKDAGPAERRRRLRDFLSGDIRYFLLGEAGGYRGQRYSGLGFSSERLLLEGGIPRVKRIDQRITKSDSPISEGSATVVWRTLWKLNVALHAATWNSYPLHPFKPWDYLTNRTPKPTEMEMGKPYIMELRKIFPDAIWIAVGNQAKANLDACGIPATKVRHPANGGATKFATELKELLRV